MPEALTAHPDAIVNASGEVALKYFPPSQVLVQNVPSGADGYLFSIRADIAMAWVKAEDVDNILARKTAKPCCPGDVGKRYQLANESDVRRWQNNGGG